MALIPKRPEFLTLTETAALVGVAKGTIRRLVAEGALTVLRDPLDRRVKLIRRADAEKLHIRK